MYFCSSNILYHGAFKYRYMLSITDRGIDALLVMLSTADRSIDDLMPSTTADKGIDNLLYY